MNDYVVITANNKKTYTKGLGFQPSKLLRQLQFPPAPYSKAGAETLCRQMKQLQPGLKLMVVPYKES